MERFEENLGRNTYVTLAELKNYLQISSNTHDEQLTSSIQYATSVVEHYIGQEVKANTYTEVFDGGTPSVYTSRIPLANVYSVAQYDGSKYTLLKDPTVQGLPNYADSDNISFNLQGNAQTSNKAKKFGDYSLKLDESSFIDYSPVPEHLQLSDSNFTIEAYVRLDTPYIQDNVFFSMSTDSDNYIELKMANAYGIAYTSVVDGDSYIVRGSNSYVERQQYSKRRWAHIAFTRDLDNDKAYLHYNGNLIANMDYAETDLTFTSNIVIGSGLVGYIDDFRISTDSKYCAVNFTPPQRHTPDEHTVLLLHFDEPNERGIVQDSHAAESDFIFTRDTGKIDVNVEKIGNTSIFGNAKFKSLPNAVKVTYKAGYDTVPIDLKLATLDLAKILYKQDQDKQRFSFEGESGDKFTLSSNFPPHIRRVLDMYRLLD